MLERLLVEQRLGVARAQQAQVAPARSPTTSSTRSSTGPRMAQISAPPRVTSVDVARRAGVSQSTVSLVLSGKAPRADLRAHGGGGPRRGRASSATARTSRPARCAPASRARVALVVPDITNPFFGRVLRGAQRAAQRAGYTVVLVDIGNDRAWEAASLQALLAGPADGLLLFEADAAAGRDRARDPDRDAPRRAAGRAARRRGGRRLRARPPARARPHADRPPRLELRRADVRPAPRARCARAPRRATPPTARRAVHVRGAARGRRAAARRGDVTAVFCDDDILAGGVYLAARERGIAIPERPVASSASTTSTSRACSRRR